MTKSTINKDTAETQEPRNHSTLISMRGILGLCVVLLHPLTAQAASSSQPGEHRLEQMLQNFEIQNIDPGEFIRKIQTAQPVSFNIHNRQFQFQMRPRDLRSPRFKAETTLANGERRPVLIGPPQTYQADLPGEPGGQARFTIRGDSFEGVILTRDDWYFVEPLVNFSTHAPQSDFITYRRSDLRPDALGTCAGSLSHRLNRGMELSVPDFGGSAAAGYVAEIATEADYEYVTALGGESQANNEIQRILNQVEGVYQTELGISFSVVYQHTWTADTDPYTSTAPNSMLQEFTNYWNSNFSTTNYDLAHMWTGKDMDSSTVGIAWLDVICSKRYSYGVSQRLTGDPAKFIVTAHEMGHNFGATHPDQENPPHTECANTIMNSSIGSGFTFCPFSLDQINTTLAQGAPCLGGGTTVPLAPSNLAATTLSTTRISLTWQDNSTNETGFKIQRKTDVGGAYAEIATTGANVASYTDTGLTAGTTYYYKVQAGGASGDSAFSNEASATTQSSSSPPAISSFSPTSGPVGTQVVIRGTNFSGATIVKFNNMVAGSFTVSSSTQITAYVPTGATTGLISVTTPAGTAVSATSFQVTSCSYALSSYSQTFPVNGGSGTLQVIAGNGCPWTAVSDSTWIVLNASSSGSGNGSVSYTVTANTGSQSRSGLISIADQIFGITQAGGQQSCTYSLSSNGESFAAAGGKGSFSILTSDTCNWEASSTVAWITFTSTSSGTGNGTIKFQVATNSSAAERTGKIVAAGINYTVTQSAPGGGSGSATIFLPVVLSSGGVGGAFYTTELTLTNRGSSNATLDFYYTASIGSGRGHGMATLAAGRQLLVPDAINYLQRTGIPIGMYGNQVGTLLVKFSGLSSSSDGAVTVRIGTSVQNGRAGLAFNGIPLSLTLSGPAFLCGLRQNLTDRSNLALQNAGLEGDGDITLKMTILSGERDHPVSQVLPLETLPPGGFKQISGILYSNGLNLSEGFVKVERMSGTAPYYAYAVINDQVTSDGSFVAPIIENAASGKHKLILPVIVETATFSSELIVTNWGPVPATLRCGFVADSIQAPDSTAVFNLELQPGEQMIIPELVGWLRTQGVQGIGAKGLSYVGPLFVESSNGDLGSIAVMARTSSQGGGGHYGLFYGSLPQGTAPASAAWIFGLQQTSQSRTNLALINTAETDGGNDVFRIEIFDGLTGLKVSNLDSVSLKAKGWVQIGSIMAQYASGVSQGYARITRTSGNNPFISYAVINDGARPGAGTGDGAYLPIAP